MKYCSKCGKEINDEDNFCQFCGEKVNKNYEKIINKNYSNNETLCYVLGICSYFANFIFTPIIAIVLAIVGLYIAKKDNIENGKIVNIVALIVSICLMVLILFFIVIYCCMIGIIIS